MRKAVKATTLVLALLIATLTEISLVNLSEANPVIPPPRLPFVYIRADGTVEPSGLPIKQDGETYRFTNDISNYSIWVERDNIIIDGQGFTLQGNRSNGIVAHGIILEVRRNVTIKNFNITTFEEGIWNVGSIGITVANNHISGCDQGITFVGNVLFEYDAVVSTVNNTIVGNIIEGNGNGINMLGASHFSKVESNIIANNSDSGIFLGADSNMVKSNIIAGNNQGIRLGAVNNTFIANNITNNYQGVVLCPGAFGKNAFYLNNFVNNGKHATLDSRYVYTYAKISSTWDNGLIGNYWSNYTTSDADRNGIGDSPYIIDANNQDNCPLMHPWNALQVTVLSLKEFHVL